jgi:hypothetical protein
MWQFLCGLADRSEDARVVGLHSILQLDSSVAELANLPLGWRAWRAARGESWSRCKEPRLVSAQEYRATAVSRMLDITGREDDVHPEGVIDFDSYLAAIPDGDLNGARLIGDAPPELVYLGGDGRFTHVLYRCTTPNVFLVVIIQHHPDDVFGHFLLDLNAEYGLEPGAH